MVVDGTSVVGASEDVALLGCGVGSRVGGICDSGSTHTTLSTCVVGYAVLDVRFVVCITVPFSAVGVVVIEMRAPAALFAQQSFRLVMFTLSK